MAETLNCGTRDPADDVRLSALDRSHIFLPDRNEGAARAHLAQGQKRILCRLRRGAADSHRVGMSGAPSSLTLTRENGGRSRLSSRYWEGPRYRTETR